MILHESEKFKSCLFLAKYHYFSQNYNSWVHIDASQKIIEKKIQQNFHFNNTLMEIKNKIKQLKKCNKWKQQSKNKHNKQKYSFLKKH